MRSEAKAREGTESISTTIERPHSPHDLDITCDKTNGELLNPSGARLPSGEWLILTRVQEQAALLRVGLETSGLGKTVRDIFDQAAVEGGLRFNEFVKLKDDTRAQLNEQGIHNANLALVIPGGSVVVSETPHTEGVKQAIVPIARKSTSWAESAISWQIIDVKKFEGCWLAKPEAEKRESKAPVDAWRRSANPEDTPTVRALYDAIHILDQYSKSHGNSSINDWKKSLNRAVDLARELENATELELKRKALCEALAECKDKYYAVRGFAGPDASNTAALDRIRVILGAIRVPLDD
jgi:hypothetical protein